MELGQVAPEAEQYGQDGHEAGSVQEISMIQEPLNHS